MASKKPPKPPEDGPERGPDDAGDSPALFGESPLAAGRPPIRCWRANTGRMPSRTWSGQEAMVRTLTNAFKTGRIAHAFMLTGVRGVGKTTTARLLARALNYESDTDPPAFDRGSDRRGPALRRHHGGPAYRRAGARRRLAYRASTEMRDLLDGARYAPV